MDFPSDFTALASDDFDGTTYVLGIQGINPVKILATDLGGTGGGTGISHAPSDGSFYASKNGAWTVFTPGGGGTGAGYLPAHQLYVPDQTAMFGSIAIGGGLRNLVTPGHIAESKNNTFFGIAAGRDLGLGTTPGSNQAFGNSGFGVEVMRNATSAFDNTGMGYQTLINLVSGFNNAALGPKAGYSMTDGSRNVMLGTTSLYTSTSATENVAIGVDAMFYSGNSVSQCVLIGYSAGYSTLLGQNTGVGYRTMGGTPGRTSGVCTGSQNSALGRRTLYSLTSGSTNVAIGNDCMLTATTATDNVAIGAFAMQNSTACIGNVVVGSGSGFNLQSNYNVIVGAESLKILFSGANNVGIGYEAGNATNASNCVFIGYRAGKTATGTTGNHVIIGANGAQGLIDGTGIVSIGGATSVQSGGDYQIVIGYGAVSTNLGTAVGYGATTFGSNSTALGNGATCTASNQIVLGNGTVSQLVCNAPSITAPSDQRLKTDRGVSTLGRDFIRDIIVHDFEFNSNSGRAGQSELGVFAQELHSTAQAHGAEWVGFVTPGDTGKFTAKSQRWMVTQGKLIFPMLTAIQQLDQDQLEIRSEVETLRGRVETLEQELDTLKNAA